MGVIEQDIIYKKLIAAYEHEVESAKGGVHMQKQIELMQSTAENTFNRPVASGVPALGTLVVFIKKVIRRFIAWYTNPFASQQTVYNLSSLHLSKALHEQLAAQQEETKKLHARIEQLELTVVSLQQQQKGQHE